MNQIKLYNLLAYLGSLPFVISALLMHFGTQHIAVLGDVTFIASSYALVIVVFMSGIHWGNYLSDKNSNTINLLLISNVITVLSWLVFLTITSPYVFLFYALAFCILLIIDMKLFKQEVLTKKYFITRCFVTFIVVTSLIIMMLSLTS